MNQLLLPFRWDAHCACVPRLHSSRARDCPLAQRHLREKESERQRERGVCECVWVQVNTWRYFVFVTENRSSVQFLDTCVPSWRNCSVVVVVSKETRREDRSRTRSLRHGCVANLLMLSLNCTAVIHGKFYWLVFKLHCSQQTPQQCETNAF